MTLSTAPIGVFDSGIGGLSVWREIVRQLPAERTVYFADQAHLPYGPRSLTEVCGFARGVTRFLLDAGAKMIVVACNAASGAALHHLRETFPDVPFVGMEPAVKPAAEHTRTGVVGIIATSAAFQGELFQRLVERFATQVRLETQVCPGLVEAIEAGEASTPTTETLLRGYLAPLLAANIDQLVLGCTHYPFASETIARIVGPGVTLIDPAPAVARQIARVLAQLDALAPAGNIANHQFYTSGDPAQLTVQSTQLVGYTGPILRATWNGERLTENAG